VATILVSYHDTVFEACFHYKQEMKLSNSIEDKFLATSKNNYQAERNKSRQDELNGKIITQETRPVHNEWVLKQFWTFFHLGAA